VQILYYSDASRISSIIGDLNTCRLIAKSLNCFVVAFEPAAIKN